MKNYSNNEIKILMTFGSNVRILRNELKISQEELAFQADISCVYLSEIENGKRNISIFVILRIAQALKADVMKLFEGIN